MNDAPANAVAVPLIRRLSLAQLVQHWALVGSFVALALTGLPLRFPDYAPLAALYNALGGLVVARGIHRAAAVVMTLVALAHFVYALVLLARAGFDARRAWPMLPTRKDARDWWETSLYYLWRRATLPAYDRHHFREKVHYFCVLWGVPVMAFSGMVLWFPIFFGNWLPDRALGMAYIAHSDEAILAVSVVILWHLYNVHVSPGAYHRFMTWIDGKITREEWLIQHPLEAERQTGESLSPERRTRMLEESLLSPGVRPPRAPEGETPA